MKKLFALAMAAFLAAQTADAAPYKIDQSHAIVGFKVTHMVVSKTAGKFNEFDATFEFDPDNLDKSSVMATIQAGSIDTNNEKRDGHLKSGDFFDVENTPTITFSSSNIVKDGDSYIAHGNLTLRGVTKHVELPFAVTGPISDPYGNGRLGVEAKLTINRQEFGVSWSKTMDTGGLVVSDDVHIEIDAEFVHKKAE
ncbi:MAG: polyisoprenoid-binding protein [Candidatus Latescibacteria bacterium]|nr:polyisoprenoid-binding protein [Candidatus Latescibacterota bacterium]